MTMARHSLIELLSEEHKVILEFLALIDKGIQVVPSHPEDFQKLVSAFKFYLHDLHHFKEESILFPFLRGSSRLRQGGPECSYFFGQFLNSRHKEVFCQLQKTAGISGSDEFQRSDSEATFLSVPLEEHAAGHIALSLIEKFVAEASENSNRAEKHRLLELNLEYQKLMRLHVEKEEKCLFVLSENILSNSSSEDLLDLALTQNRERAEEIEKCLETLRAGRLFFGKQI